MRTYYSERRRGLKPRTTEVLSDAVWRGIVALAERCCADGSFGCRFPLVCPDGPNPIGTDADAFWPALVAEVPEAPPRLVCRETPKLDVALDILEFCRRAVGKPILGSYHRGYDHRHLEYDLEAGQQEFADTVNGILRRNELAFVMSTEGMMERVGPSVLQERLRNTEFCTGDDGLDELLATAKRKIASPKLATRREAIDALWDGWERLKTLERPGDKKESTILLLDKTAAEPAFRELVGVEASALTAVGNTFRIRHHEVGKVPVSGGPAVDYLFHRLYALIRLCLVCTRRGA